MKSSVLTTATLKVAICALLIINASRVMAADTTNPVDPELAKKQLEASIAEAEARKAEAEKKIAEARKAAAEAADAELQAAQRAKAVAEANKAVADADKAAFAAELPTPSSKPLEGKIDLDDKAGYFSELLAYRSLKESARELARKIDNRLKPNDEVYLVSKFEWLQAAFQLKQVEGRLDQLNELLKLEVPETKTNKFHIEGVPALAALSAIPAVAGSIADIAAMFRQDRSLKGRTITLNQTALLAESAQALKDESSVRVIVPMSKLDGSSPLMEQIEQLQTNANELRKKWYQQNKTATLAQLTLEHIEEQIRNASNRLSSLPAEKKGEREQVEEQIEDLRNKLFQSKQAKADVDAVKAHYETILKTFDEFVAKLSNIPEGGAVSPLVALSEVSLLSSKSQVLFVSVISQGGEVETRKSIWTSGRIYHRGGTVCCYVLFKPDGEILASGTIEKNHQTKEGKPQ